MSDWPAPRYHLPVISVFSPESLGCATRSLGNNGTPASGTWPVANLAVYVPFQLAAPYLWRGVFWANGATATGSIDCGVYTRNGARISTIGPTTQSGVSVIQAQTISAPVLLEPNSYYMAISASLAATTFVRANTGLEAGRAMGILQQTAAGTLPSPATFAVLTNTGTPPAFGITSQTVV